MARTGLDWRGEPANRYVSGLSCANMTGLLSIWLAINASGLAMLRVAWQRGFLIGAEYYSPLILFNVLLWMYMVSLTAKVRASIRNKYQIPDESCTGSEDCLCATFCMPCAICQMGRHTADYETYTATCCTSTGLPRQVKLAPVTFYDDQYQNMHDESQGHVV
jgi:Cys-rich protein (TIGR01571 family)